jgi:hypothetical protein
MIALRISPSESDCKGSNHAYRQDFPRPALDDGTQRPLDGRKCIFDRGRQRRAFISENQPASGAAKQGRSEMVFQCLHLMAYGGLGDAQFLGCAREAEMLRRGFEGSQDPPGKLSANARQNVGLPLVCRCAVYRDVVPQMKS